MLFVSLPCFPFFLHSYFCLFILSSTFLPVYLSFFSPHPHMHPRFSFSFVSISLLFSIPRSIHPPGHSPPFQHLPSFFSRSDFFQPPQLIHPVRDVICRSVYIGQYACASAAVFFFFRLPFPLTSRLDQIDLFAWTIVDIVSRFASLENSTINNVILLKTVQ